VLMDLCQADLRCLDAHSHLGNFVFYHRPNDAIRHYEVGFTRSYVTLNNEITIKDIAEDWNGRFAIIRILRTHRTLIDPALKLRARIHASTGTELMAYQGYNEAKQELTAKPEPIEL